MNIHINKIFKIHLRKNAYLKPSYKIEKDVNFNNIKPPYKYIFFRLYDVEYLNPLLPGNILKFGVDATEIYDVHASHVSINFSLQDNFYGLTTGGKYQLAREYCTQSEINKFTKQCNPKYSNQITYALRVNEEEYKKVQKFVEDYASSKEIRFDILQDFQLASFATKRKFFTDKDEQLFGHVNYPKDKYRRLIKKIRGENEKENYFVCSSFIAYSLIKNVPRIRNWFKKNDINYRYVNVTDVVNIPGTAKLFASKFYEYNKAAREFTNFHKEFIPYL